MSTQPRRGLSARAKKFQQRSDSNREMSQAQGRSPGAQREPGATSAADDNDDDASSDGSTPLGSGNGGATSGTAADAGTLAGRGVYEDADALRDRRRAEQIRLTEETNALLQHSIQSSVSYQTYLHKFCLCLQEWGHDDMVTNGVETKHDPPCQRLEDLRSQCRPGQNLQPRLRQVTTLLMRNFLVQLRVENRYKGASKGKMIVPAHGTHSWYRNALSHAFRIAEVPKPDDWDVKLGEFIGALKKKQAKQKAAGTFEGRHTGGRDKMDFDVYRRAMFDFVTGNLSSNNPKNADKERNKTSDVDQIAGAKFCIDFWNFMCRSDNVKRLKWGDTSYACDYRNFKFHVSKNDQQGQKLSTTQLRHVFANPIMPEICPFLTEALYVLLVEAPFGDKVFETGIVKKLADL